MLKSTYVGWNYLTLISISPITIMFMVLLAIILREENTLIAHIIVLIIRYMFLSLQSCTNLIVVLSNLVPLLVTIMREEERLIFMFLCYLKCNLLIITYIGYHKIAAIYSYIKCQCIEKELDLKVNGLMFCVVLFMLLFPIRFEHTFISWEHAK